MLTGVRSLLTAIPNRLEMVAGCLDGITIETVSPLTVSISGHYLL